ncbi:MAG: hypothetical protein JWO96_218 [Candidatus Saccharibacteria bacterium]|nr:hypothetical protein [Candidatus Saccharibacteria bacterium]
MPPLLIRFESNLVLCYAYYMDYIEKTIQAYDSSADKYASSTDDMANKQEIQQMLDYMPDGEKVILDVGCGPGRDAQIMTDNGISVIGIDMSKELIKKAQQLHPGINFALMDVRNLEFPDNSFGAVWCNMVLLHLNDEDLKTALVEIHRILKPEGIVAISFKKGDGAKEVLETFSTDLSRFYNFKTQETLNQMVEEQNFEVLDSHEFNERQRFGSDKRDLDIVWTFAKKLR